MTTDYRRALACALHYRRQGLCPLPSRANVKMPDLDSYAEYWDKPLPEETYSERNWQTPNIQIMAGARTPGATKLAVVDCDGEEAIETWSRICAMNAMGKDRTWAVRTGSGGMHVYFRLSDPAAPCPSGILWGLWDTFGDNGKGKWVKHKEVRLLADGALVVAPPSLHVETGRRYEFLDGCSPRDVALPAFAPAWLLAMPRLVAPRCVETPKSEHIIRTPTRLSGAFYRREEVLAAIDDKIALAASWGLRIASRGPNANGWVSCFAAGRDDRSPSASFHAIDGTYQDRKDLRAISLFDLGAELGRFSTWQECRDWCGDQFCPRLNPTLKPNSPPAPTPPNPASGLHSPSSAMC